MSDNLLRVSPATAQRHTAEERREAIIDVAQDLFAVNGFYGTSTDEIARRAGISQPYLFRLFGTKKELFVATVEHCLAQALELFQTATEGLSGKDALDAISVAYRKVIAENPRQLQAQLQAYAACDDPEIREVVRRGYGRLVEHVEAVSGASAAEVSAFFAMGMLLNVVTMLKLNESRAGWATRLLEGTRRD